MTLSVSDTAPAGNGRVRGGGRRATPPDDLSLIVFDDNPGPNSFSPPLSVVRQPIDMLVLHSVEPGGGRLRGALTDPRHIRVNAEFVRRSSAAPAPFT
jgi:LacI family transcriptional regulator